MEKGHDLLPIPEESKVTVVLQSKQKEVDYKKLKSFSEFASSMNLTEQDKMTYSERILELEKTIIHLSELASGYRIEAQQVSKAPVGDPSKIPKRNQFTRPPRRVWYTPLPLTIKKYYRTNWKKIRYDVREEMRERDFWPKLWINFEENHPKKLHELIKAKVAVKAFDKYGFKREFDWGRGVHPDYIDWILEDIVPHPGQYYYDEGEGDWMKDKEAVRRASLQEGDFQQKNWFMKPPRYIPGTPLSPPFDQYDFCGYGNRETPYFLDFTVPREILHYYAPPSNIERFFRQIPKPPYAFPGYTFKRWLRFPLEQKLPQYYPFPKRFSIWTRGKIGDSIHGNSSSFKLDDPLIQKLDITYNPYHDPHTRKYFLKKPVLDRLFGLGIINSKGEVKCTMKEFNQNRRYLRDYEWLEECVRRWTLKWTARLEHNRLTKDTNIALLDWESKTQVWQLRLERCKVYRKIRTAEEAKHNVRLQQEYDKALVRACQKKDIVRHQMMIRGRKMRREQRVRKRNLQSLMMARGMLLQRIYALRHKKAAKIRKQFYLTRVVEKLEKKKDTYQRHVEFAQRKMEEVKMIQRELEKEEKERNRQHENRMRRVWENIPLAIQGKRYREKRQAERRRFLAKKYFKIWRRVVEQRRRNDDEEHTSVWTYEHVLEKYVHYLRDLSGIVKIENVLFQAVRMRFSKSTRSMGSVLGKKEVKVKKMYANDLRFQVEREMCSNFGKANKVTRPQTARSSSAQDYSADDEEGEEGDELELDGRPETKGYEGDLDDDVTIDDDGDNLDDDLGELQLDGDFTDINGSGSSPSDRE